MILLAPPFVFHNEHDGVHFIFNKCYHLLATHIEAMSCIEAEAEIEGPTAKPCNDILTSGDIFDMSDDNIQKFCTDHNCPSVLAKVYGDMAEACGNGIVK